MIRGVLTACAVCFAFVSFGAFAQVDVGAFIRKDAFTDIKGDWLGSLQPKTTVP